MRLAELEGRRVLVVGGGLTGGSVARFLARHGVAFDLVDDNGVPGALAALVTRGAVHERLDAALARAQDVILLSPGIPRSHEAVRAALADGVRVAGDVELFADAVAVPVVAVTGSNGKSTVVAWLADLLGRLGVRAAACGNIGLPALDSLADDVDCHVLELSSYQLESTTSLAPRVAAVLNVSDDHLDRYDSLADYAAVKRGVYANAAHVLFDVDDAATVPGPDVAGIRVRFTARALDVAEARRADEEPAPVAGDGVSHGSGVPDAVGGAAEGGGRLWHRASIGAHPWLCRDGEPLVAQSRLALPGSHNAANALAVLALLESLGATGDAIDATTGGSTTGPSADADPLAGLFAAGEARTRALDALCAFRGLPHRTRLVGEADGVRWYDDSKGTNVDACLKAVEAMPGPVLLIAGGQSKGADFAPLRPVVARRARAVVLIGQDRMRLHAALEGAAPLHLEVTLADAVARCGTLARPGDAVLLSPACASFDMFADFADRGRRFAALVTERLGVDDRDTGTTTAGDRHSGQDTTASSVADREVRT